MGNFLRDFQITSRMLHGNRLHPTADILAKLKAHLPKP
jgi:hypothetical protein